MFEDVMSYLCLVPVSMCSGFARAELRLCVAEALSLRKETLRPDSLASRPSRPFVFSTSRAVADGRSEQQT